jgi:hypothetical protein
LAVVRSSGAREGEMETILARIENEQFSHDLPTSKVRNEFAWQSCG